LPEDGHMSLVIYNLVGQEVKRLVDEEMKAGYHQVVWNGLNETGRKTQTGIYLFRMKAKQLVISKKLLLIQ